MKSEELIRLAQSSIGAQRADEAADYCVQVLDRDPANRDALHLLALARNMSHRTDEALGWLEKAIEAAPNFAPAYNDYGTIQLAANRPEQALESLQKAIQLKPDFADAHVNLGNALHRLGSFSSAEEAYRRGVELDPRHSRGWVSLGNLLRTTRKFEAAVECFKTALEMQPDNPVIHDFLGVGYRNLGEKELALDCFRRALELDPDLPQANSNFGGALMGRGEFREAVAYLDKGKSDRAVGNAAECLLRLGAYDELLDRIDTLAQQPQVNLNIASISAYVADRLGRADPYPFCPNPLDFVRVSRGADIACVDEEFLQELIQECVALEAFWEPIGVTTRKGFQTPMSIFRDPSGALAKLSRLIHDEVDLYREQFRDRQASLITRWPDQTALRGWFVKLMREGHQRTHNHTDAWLSGCFYLQIPDTANDQEGAIEFCLDGPRYPEMAGEGKRSLHKPKAGDLVLFPSSLFHRTIPFDTDDERLCIAFDIVPAA